MSTSYEHAKMTMHCRGDAACPVLELEVPSLASEQRQCQGHTVRLIAETAK